MKSMTDNRRDEWLAMPDDELFSNCRTEFFKASGRGGQKRNKTSSAVRITHEPTQLAVTDCSGRSQHQNRRQALNKLRIEIALNIRLSPPAPPERIDVSISHPEYPLWAARVLDILDSADYRPSEAASFLGLSASRLVKLLARDPQLWQFVNRSRAALSLPALKN